MKNEYKKQIEIFKNGVLWILSFLIFPIMFCGCSKLSKVGNIDENIISIAENDEFEKFDINFNDEGIEILSTIESKANMSTVVLTGEDFGRSDPFMPGAGFVGNVNLTGGFDLLPPPEVITVDTEATEVITTKVSGILYDTLNPSAIINIGGSDYLVRTGDVINGYKVLSIAKEYVAVQYGVNVYKAGVGELFNANEITHNTVSNLENKFGGNKDKY